jgi:Anaphase-promoting complex, cyclosome, subunit 3
LLGFDFGMVSDSRLRTMITNQTTDRTELLNQAQSLFDDELYESALLLTELLLTLRLDDPSFSQETNLLHAQSLYKMGEYKRSLKFFQHSLKNVAVRVQFGDACVRAKQYYMAKETV